MTTIKLNNGNLVCINPESCDDIVAVIKEHCSPELADCAKELMEFTNEDIAERAGELAEGYLLDNMDLRRQVENLTNGLLGRHIGNLSDDGYLEYLLDNYIPEENNCEV